MAGEKNEFDAADSDQRGLTRAQLLARLPLAAGALALGPLAGGQATAARWRPPNDYSSEVAASWFDLALELVRTTPGFSPPVASRAFGYAGVALYESVVPGIRGRDGLSKRLNGLPRLRHGGGPAYHWPTVANGALASILRSLFPTTPSANVAAIDALEHRFSAEGQAMLPRGIHKRSTARGAEVARQVFEWSKGDGGHEGFARNFPPYTPPSGPGLWLPTPLALSSALQPSWGSNRPFLLRPGQFPSPGPPPSYSEDPASDCFAEAHECYLAVKNLSPEQTAIARFWSDDPGRTPTPSGHSISICTQVIRQLDVSLDRAAEAYAKVGIAVADAFISCWETKFRYNLLRPVTYIRRLIDPNWMPLLVTPPFPEYTSGHSVQSAATAQVLTDLFGDRAFTDRTHEAAGLPPRSFASFRQAAEEAGMSRLYGGIHFRAAIERGLQQGTEIGKQVSALI